MKAEAGGGGGGSCACAVVGGWLTGCRRPSLLPFLRNALTAPTPCARVWWWHLVGRWVLPFRAVWTPAGDGAVIGNMKRGLDVFSVATGGKGRVAQLVSDFMTAIPCRATFLHGAAPVLAAATSSGRVHVWK